MIAAVLAGMVLTAPGAVAPHEDAADCQQEAMCSDAVEAVSRWTNAVNARDWATAQQLQPSGPTPDEYQEAFGSTVAAWTELAAWAPAASGVELWLIRGSHSGPDELTSALCVRWFYDTSNGTLTELDSGLAAFERDGFLYPDDFLPDVNLVFECSAFDMPLGVEVGPPGTLVVDGQRFACEYKGYPDYDCMSYSGLETPEAVTSVNLRCSGSVFEGGFECTREDFYPSEFFGYELWQVDGQAVLCHLGTETWMDISQDPCWYWDGETLPSELDRLSPDFVCSTEDAECIVTEDGTVISYDLPEAYVESG